jgi:hypothetical protein
MNRKNRLALWALLEPQLPDGYETSGEHDDFVNRLVDNKLGPRQGTKRVLRIVGPQRCIVVFDTATPRPKNQGLWTMDYTMRYLSTHSLLVAFECDRGLEGPWLAAKGARTFTGRGWKDDLVMKVLNCVTRWERHYSGITPSNTIASLRKVS